MNLGLGPSHPLGLFLCLITYPTIFKTLHLFPQWVLYLRNILVSLLYLHLLCISTVRFLSSSVHVTLVTFLFKTLSILIPKNQAKKPQAYHTFCSMQGKSPNDKKTKRKYHKTLQKKISLATSKEEYLLHRHRTPFLFSLSTFLHD